jgi:hypothetical protein
MKTHAEIDKSRQGRPTKGFNAMSSTSFMLQPIRITIGRVFVAVAPKHWGARRATQETREPNMDRRLSRNATSSISDVVVFGLADRVRVRV